MVTENTDELMHYGILRKSGRYPWGSGLNPYQRSISFLGLRDEYRKQGLSDPEISKLMGFDSTTQFRNAQTIAKNAKLREDQATAAKLKRKGMGNSAIGRQMGLNESSVRALLDESRQARADRLTSTVDMLRDRVDNSKYVDIGLGSEVHLGISKELLASAVAVLEDEGYNKYNIHVELVTNPGKYTDIKTLVQPETTYHETVQNKDKIVTIHANSDNFGLSYDPIVPPRAISSDRVQVRYGPEGGGEMDGVLEIRPGVEDTDLGGKRYAQVRVNVDNTHYMKGMAIYANDLPAGVDIRYNTPKESTGNKLDAMKKLDDISEDNPFGAIVTQKYYTDKDGNRQLSVMNRVGSPMKEGAGEEGGWDWKDRLSSQMLSKQTPELAKRQLDLALQDRRIEYDEIKSLTNPAVKRKLLESFSEDCDSAAQDLAAAALPRQKNHVIIPITTLGDNEIYAPGYKNGERVVLIRHPHGGTFEIPELKVNNRNRKGIEVLGNAIDAVGINYKVAKQLSGADFDGDTVIVIPNTKKYIKTSRPLKELEDFDPISSYPGYEGMKKLEGKAKQTEMGKVSNLITDMTIKGAPPEEIARAVKHSMVVIDAEKHNLNWQLSARENGIPALKKEYQGASNAGAATIISRSKSEESVLKRKPRSYSEGGPVNRETGELEWTPTGENYIKTTVSKRGVVKEQVIFKTDKSTKMAETKDAYSLSSGQAMESIYADHANKLKAMANGARLDAIRTPPMSQNPAARQAYSVEVGTLNAKLNVAKKNKPYERQAQAIARVRLDAVLKDNPHLEPSKKKKIRSQIIERARVETGASSKRIQITPREWDAIQAGAISHSKLVEILQHTEDSVVRQYATPRTSTAVSPAKLARAKLMSANGYTQAEIAEQLGISKSTISKALNG